MRAIKHSIKHYYQPTNSTCGYAALSTLLSFYNKNISVEVLLSRVKQPIDDKGQPAGSITAELVSWCLEQGFSSILHSFDCLILDLSWQSLTQSKLLEKIESLEESRDVLGLGIDYGRRYLKAYAEMIKAGGTLSIKPNVTRELIYELLKSAPVYANVCSGVMDNLGRTKVVGLREFTEDDIYGSLHTHSIVIYGYNTNGDFLVSDPWRGLRTIDVDKLLCSITMAQIECDNMLFQLAIPKKSNALNFS